MKEYRLNEETWKLFMLALNKAPYELVIPILEKIRTEVKLVNIRDKQQEATNDQEQTNTSN